MIANWLTLSLALTGVTGLGWQIRRDVKKDHKEAAREAAIANQAAIERAVEEAARDAELVRLRRELEERDRDDNDTP